MILIKRMRETLSYDDVTLAPAFSKLKSRSNTDPSMHDFNLPIMASCMDVLGPELSLYLYKENIPMIAHRAFKSAKEQFDTFRDYYYTYQYQTPISYKNLWFAVGSVQKYKDWIDYLYRAGVRQFCVDMAHGDSQACIDTIKYIKTLFYKCSINGLYEQRQHIIAGNVATAEGFKRLQKAGANGIRVGIASGSICSTNIETAMGLPVLTSIIDCYKVKNKNTWLIADGGIRSAGDIVKAVYFGADFCLIGKLFAATDLSSGICYNKNKEIINSEHVIYNPNDIPEMVGNAIATDHAAGKISDLTTFNKDDYYTKFNNNIVIYKSYHGMASRAARSNILGYAAVEGVEGLINYSGTTEQFLTDTKLRLQAALSYGGATNWNEFRKNVTPYKRSISGVHAADVHMDILTKFH